MEIRERNINKSILQLWKEKGGVKMGIIMMHLSLEGKRNAIQQKD